MSSIGQIIRQERIRQNMKQSTLAEGICSSSYLSMIENHTTTPSQEVVEMLLNKLNIKLKEVSLEEEEKLIASLKSIYKDAILKRDPQQVLDYLHRFGGQKIHFRVLKNFYDYNLLMFRLFLVLREEDLTPFIDALKCVDEQFDNRQRFIFNLNMGIYYYSIFEFRKSLDILEESLEFVKQADLEDWELADYYNLMGVAYLKNEEYFRAILFIHKALDYYNGHSLFDRALDCNIFLGICYKNTSQFDKAKECYLLAQKLSTDMGFLSYESTLYHNLGSLFSLEGNHLKAIEYYHMSLDAHDLPIKESDISTIQQLIHEYSKLNNSLQVINWCQKGLGLLEDAYYDDTTAMPVSYRYHYSIFLALHQRDESLEELLNEAIEHFEQVQDLKYVHKYTVLLADYLFQIGKYKESAELFRKGETVSLQQKNLKYWEDL